MGNTTSLALPSFTASASKLARFQARALPSSRASKLARFQARALPSSRAARSFYGVLSRGVGACSLLTHAPSEGSKASMGTGFLSGEALRKCAVPKAFPFVEDH